MSKKILKLEKETRLWKQRWEKSHAALLDMAADKQARDTEMGKLTHKLSLLQELCKAFQRERTELLAQLRAVNGHTSTNVDHPKVENVDIKQVEELSKDCQQLKDDLAQLQGSLSKAIVEGNDEEVTKELTETLETNDKPEVLNNHTNSEINIVSTCESQETAIAVEDNVKIEIKEDTINTVDSDKISTVEPITPDVIDKSSAVNISTTDENKSDSIVTTSNENNHSSITECISDHLTDNKQSDSIHLTVEENPLQLIKDDAIVASIATEEGQNSEKNNAAELMVTEEKKDSVKLNNSGTTKKGNGKRKKK